MIFKRFKKQASIPKTEDLISFSVMNISSGLVAGYIRWLEYTKNFRHIEVRYERARSGDTRAVLYTQYPAPLIYKQYFADRCPALVEQEVMSMPSRYIDFTKK